MNQFQYSADRIYHYFRFLLLTFTSKSLLPSLKLTMDYCSTISGLYYLLVCVDGDVNEKELHLGYKMIIAEGFNQKVFEESLERFRTKDKANLYQECLLALKKLDKKTQIRCVSWMSVIANSDGFMDKKEWMLIYKIYHTELGLSLNEIMQTQKELNKILHGKEFLSFGVKMNK
jgi:uncharacterized tellurite resistance protein B-like protein